MFSLLERIQSYLQPFGLMRISAYYLIATILRHPLLLFRSPRKFHDHWFNAFWAYVGPQMASNPDVIAHLDPLLSLTHGTVLELGPGGGDTMVRYKAHAHQISHYYGAEPNVHLHGSLLRKLEEAGIPREKTTIMAAGAEAESLLPALKAAGVIAADGRIPEKGVFDTVVTIKSLCSSDQDSLVDTVTVIQGLLKPGGRFLWYEHLKNHQDVVTQAYVRFLNLIWPFFIGGCRLDGRLDEVCQRLGGWKTVDIEPVPWFQSFGVFRDATGNCEKA